MIQDAKGLKGAYISKGQGGQPIFSTEDPEFVADLVKAY